MGAQVLIQLKSSKGWESPGGPGSSTFLDCQELGKTMPALAVRRVQLVQG